jgi:DNA-binding helix-hairpin-helix protein with protein kinase domain
MADLYFRVTTDDVFEDPGTPISRGGEGEIRGLPNGRALKLFHDPDADLNRKLAWMIRNPIPSSGPTCDHAWPERLVFKNNQFAGYEMAYFDQMAPLSRAIDVDERIAMIPAWTYKHSVRLAGNVAHAYARFHAHGIVIGDVSPANALFDPQTTCCALIDLDSVQVDAGDHVFPCRVSTPDTTPPEVLLGKVAFDRRTIYQDAFGVAVLVFQLLLEHHPYAAILPAHAPPLTTEQRIAQNVWAYGAGKGARKIAIPPYGIPLATLPDEFAKLFDAAFNQGFAEPWRRPTPQTWIRPLERLYRSLVRCTAKPMHYRSGRVNACPWCEKRKRTGVDSFADHN